MTSKQNTAEGGSNGVAVSTANSGGTSGSAFQTVYGTAPKWSTASAADGSTAIAAQAASGAISAVEWSGLNGKDFAVRFSLRIPAYPPVSTEVCQLRNTVNAGAGQIKAYIADTGHLELNDYTGAVKFLSTAALTVNTWYDIAIRAKAGTTSTNGQLEMKYWLSSTRASPVQSFSDLTSAKAGVAAFQAARFGKASTTGWTSTLLLDSLTATDAANGALPGPVVAAAGTPPNATAEADGVCAYVDLRATGATSYAVSYRSGPTLDWSQVTSGFYVFTQDPSADAVYRFTMTNSAGSTVLDVTIPAATAGLGILRYTTAGGLT